MSNSLSANNIKIPSKRGRKKKEVPQNEFMLKILQVEEPVANTSPKEEQHNNCDPVSEEDKLEAPTIKKRGRKPKETKASIVDIDAVGNKKMPLILMLPISSSMVSMDSLTSMTQPISLFEGIIALEIYKRLLLWSVTNFGIFLESTFSFLPI